MFIGVAIVCDEYFVASLEGISEALQLSPDVAGRPIVDSAVGMGYSFIITEMYIP